MFTLTINDRELRELARVLVKVWPKNPNDASPELLSLDRKVNAIVDANIDALERIDEAEAGEALEEDLAALEDDIAEQRAARRFVRDV